MYSFYNISFQNDMNQEFSKTKKLCPESFFRDDVDRLGNPAEIVLTKARSAAHGAPIQGENHSHSTSSGTQGSTAFPIR